jgi:hypothetical protein
MSAFALLVLCMIAKSAGVTAYFNHAAQAMEWQEGGMTAEAGS